MEQILGHQVQPSGAKNKSGTILGSVCLGLCVCVSDLSSVKKKKKKELTHIVPEAVPH